MGALRRSAEARLKRPPILFTLDQAKTLLQQFHESASLRKWRLLATSIMANHFHAVIVIPRATDSQSALQTLKSYGSRALNERFGKPKSGTWWTKSGSRRLLPDEQAIASAIRYVVEKQPNPLVTWSKNKQDH